MKDRIERELKRLHFGGKYERLDVSRLDRHLRDGQLEILLERIGAVHGLVGDLDTLDSSNDRSHRLYLGLDDGPGWVEFNRQSSTAERIRAVRECGGAMTFWIVRLSRLLPLWMGSWNAFTVKDDGIAVATVPPPESWEWKSLTSSVGDELTDAGWEEVRRPLLEETLPWLNTALEDVLVKRGREPFPTLYEAVFADLY